MLEVLPEPAATVVAIAGFTGLRRGEIRGLRWEDYTPASNGSMAMLRVSRSIWGKHETAPKTAKSKAPVPVIAPVAAQLEAYRQQCGNPVAGPMFKNSAGNPLELDKLFWRVMKDIVVLKKLSWHGWHELLLRCRMLWLSLAGEHRLQRFHRSNHVSRHFLDVNVLRRGDIRVPQDGLDDFVIHAQVLEIASQPTPEGRVMFTFTEATATTF